MKGRTLLAWNLRAIRTAKSLSQERLAADANVDRAWVSELEREQGNTSVDLLDRLADALGVPIAALFAEPDAGADKPQPLRSGRRPRS
ncbi:MAG: helix-turn-helix domain-containing protein [Phenylobacterium sp.]|uniref:helix-turn-helix domain-containing protein n=1 Tax=Phenylobacterium sp. TaxID=1871053 RepID=UPI0025FEF96D|nr:helix-turn-helix transcriptional regulator [Phenylobacterium sp.]MBI1198318.1 helix-turn-helix domain-containing protein [Phenylobacterium sp.]